MMLKVRLDPVQNNQSSEVASTETTTPAADLSAPISRKRKEMTRLHRLAFKQLQKKLYGIWKPVESGFQRKDSIPLEELRQHLSSFLDEFELEHIVDALSHGIGVSKSNLNQVSFDMFHAIVYPEANEVARWELEEETKRKEKEALDEKHAAIRRQIDQEGTCVELNLSNRH